MTAIPNRPGDALVNVLAAYPDLDHLEREFDVLYFLDLCAGIEAAVLQDSLACIGPIGSFTASRVNPIVRALIDSGTLVRYEMSASDPAAFASKILAHRAAQDILAMLPREIPAQDPEAHISVIATGTEFAADLGFEAEAGLPIVLTAHSLPLFSKLPQFRAEQAAVAKLRGELAARYADFRQVLYSMRDKAYGEEAIRIPPIALEALEIAKDHDDLGNAVLAVRQKYAKVRSYFTELDELMRSKAQSPKRLLQEQAKRRKAISKLFSSQEVDGLTVLTTFATELNDTVDLAEIADGENGIDWNKVVASVMHHAVDAFWRFRLRPLHSTKRRYLELSSKRIHDIVRHHFGHQLTAADVAAAARYADVIASVEKLAP